MKNPYEVLGIPPQADEALLREAYRALAREYDGDPRRMQELNDAYDSIVLSRGQSGRREAWGGGQGLGGAADLSDIRGRIQAGRFDDALLLLDGMPLRQRDAQWYYLKGCAQRGRGWLEEAEKNFAQAARSAPKNREYQAAWAQMRENRQERRQGWRDRERSDNECLEICLGALCCECCGDCFCDNIC